MQLITDLETLHTFAGIINRTRRRDIGDFTVRKPETVVIEFTPAQKKLHDDLLQIQAEIFSQIHGDTNVKFMMTTIRRQAASCLYGLVPFLQEILNRHVDELAWEEADNTGEAPTATTVEAIETRIRMILEQARNLDPEDPKLEALRKILKDKQYLPKKRREKKRREKKRREKKRRQIYFFLFFGRPCPRNSTRLPILLKTSSTNRLLPVN